MNKHLPIISQDQKIYTGSYGSSVRPALQPGHDAYYMASGDEYEPTTNTFINIFAKKKHQVFIDGEITTPEWGYGWNSSGINSTITNYSEFYYDYDRYSYGAFVPSQEFPLKEENYFFLFEWIWNLFPTGASHLAEAVFEGQRYYYDQGSVTQYYRKYWYTQFVEKTLYFSKTIAAGWYKIPAPNIFPTPLGNPSFNFNYGAGNFQIAGTYYANGDTGWILWNGTWIRNDDVKPMEHRTSGKSYLKYVTTGGYRIAQAKTEHNINLVTISDYNATNLICELTSASFDVANNCVTVSEAVGAELKTGMTLYLVPESTDSGQVFPAMTGSLTDIFGFLLTSGPTTTASFAYSTKDPTSGNDLLFGAYVINSVCIEKISPTQIRFYPKKEYSRFGTAQKTGYDSRLGTYSQPYFDNPTNKQDGTFSRSGSNFKIFVYRFTATLPTGTALGVVSVDGLYPPRLGEVNIVEPYAPMYWSWLDSRYVDIANNKIKMTTNSLWNYFYYKKDYKTGTKVTVRHPNAIKPMWYYARARYTFSGNVPTRSGVLTIEGVKLALYDLVLLTRQTIAKDNGLYNVYEGSWRKEDPNFPYSYNINTAKEVPAYYEKVVLVGVLCDLTQEKKYTIYKNVFDEALYSEGSYRSSSNPWTLTDMDTSGEVFPEDIDSYDSGQDKRPTYIYGYTLYPFEKEGQSELPAPLLNHGQYYLINLGEYIQFAASYEDALAGVAIPLTSMGKGIISVFCGEINQGATFEKVAALDPLEYADVTEDKLYLINKPKGRFQLAKSYEDAIAGIAITPALKQNDNFCLYQIESQSTPRAGLLTRDKKYYGWDLDNPSNRTLARPSPTFNGVVAADVKASLTTNITLGTFSNVEASNTSFGSPNVASAMLMSWGNSSYNDPYSYPPGILTYTGNFAYTYRRGESNYSYYQGYSNSAPFFSTPMKYLNGVVPYGAYNDYGAFDPLLISNTPIPYPPPSTFEVLGIISETTFEVIYSGSSGLIYTVYGAFNYAYTFREYTSTKNSEITTAVINNVVAELINNEPIKFYRNENTDLLAREDNSTYILPSTSSTTFKKTAAYIMYVSVSKTFTGINKRHDATVAFTPIGGDSGGFNVSASYSDHTPENVAVGGGATLSGYIFETLVNDSSLGKTVDHLAFRSKEKFPTKLVVTASLWYTVSGMRSTVSGTAEYTLIGETFTKTSFTGVDALPQTFTVTGYQYYYPRDKALKIQLDSTVYHNWKKLTAVSAGYVDNHYYYGPTTRVTNSNDITELSYEQKASDLSGDIVCTWSDSAKRYQSEKKTSLGVPFRVEALIGRVPLDNIFDNSNRVSTQGVYDNDSDHDFHYVSLFGSPNTWITIPARRILSDKTNTIVEGVSTKRVLVQTDLALSSSVSSNFPTYTSGAISQYYYGAYGVPPSEIFAEVSSINSYQNLLSRSFKNNGYELAIADCIANRWPWNVTVARMDIPNNINNGTALSLIGGAYGISDNTLGKDYVIDIVDDINSLAVAGYPRFSVYSSKTNLYTTDIPTVTIQTRNGSLGQGAVVKATVSKQYVNGGTTGPYYYRFTGFEVISAGYNYKRGTTKTTSISSESTSTDYALITYTLYSTGATVTAFAAVAIGSNSGTLLTSYLYPYRMKGLDSYTLVPHVAAPVTIGLIKKITIE